MKVPRRSLFALAVGFLFPGFRSDPDPAPPPPELRLTKKPVKESTNGDLVFSWKPEYICPIHGDIGVDVISLTPDVGREPVVTFCFRCMLDQLKKLPIARLGE